MSLLVDHLRSDLNLVKLDILGSGDAYENAGSTCDAGFKERGRDSSHSSELSLVGTLSSTNTHVSVACILHNGGNVCKVEVNESGNVDKLGNGLYTATENVVCNFKSVSKSDIGILYLLESLVGDNDERVYVLGELCDTCLCLLHSLTTLKSEGLGNDTNGKDAHFLSSLSNYGSRTCTGSAAHTCGDEYHVRAVKHTTDLFDGFLSALLTDLRVRTCALTSGNLIADDYLLSCARAVKHLAVGVDRYKFNATNVGGDHAVNCVVSAAAYTNNLYRNATIIYLLKIKFHFAVKHFIIPP